MVTSNKLNTYTAKALANAIRQGASQEYKSKVPEITDVNSLNKVGVVFSNFPNLANEYFNHMTELVWQVFVKSADFENPLHALKKGTATGTIEQMYIKLAKAREFRKDRGAGGEYARNLPDVNVQFHTVNYQAQYATTIENVDLNRAFQNFEQFDAFNQRVVSTLTTAMEYDEFLLFQYLLIKGVTHGQMRAKKVTNDQKELAIQYRSDVLTLPFLSKENNLAEFTTKSDPDDLYLFMTADAAARFDVEVLAAAFNMEKADFLGHVIKLPDFATFDNERFSELVDKVDPVTQEELALMQKVKGMLIDKAWFQVYNVWGPTMTSVQSQAGLYQNFFLSVSYIISHSDYDNAIVYLSEVEPEPETVDVKVIGVASSGNATEYILTPVSAVNVYQQRFKLDQQDTDTAEGIAVDGSTNTVTFTSASANTTLKAHINTAKYTAGSALSAETKVGDIITFTKD